MHLEHEFELTDYTLEVKTDFWVETKKETPDTPPNHGSKGDIEARNYGAVYTPKKQWQWKQK